MMSQFNKGSAVSQIGANPRDDIARKTEGMRLWRSVVWSRVSNAADMSRVVRIVIFPESMVSMISFVSLSRAVSVE